MSDYVWLRPQYKQDLEESFFPFLPQKMLSSSNKQFCQCPRRETKQHKDHGQSLREVRLQNSKRRTGRSKSLNLWEGEETWHTKLAEPCLKIHKAFATPSTKAKPEVWEHRHCSASELFRHCPPHLHLSAAGSLSNTHCSKGQTLPIHGTSWAFPGCSFWGLSSNNRTNIYTKAQRWAATQETSPKALTMKARWTMHQVFRGV